MHQTVLEPDGAVRYNPRDTAVASRCGSVEKKNLRGEGGIEGGRTLEERAGPSLPCMYAWMITPLRNPQFNKHFMSAVPASHTAAERHQKEFTVCVFVHICVCSETGRQGESEWSFRVQDFFYQSLNSVIKTNTDISLH